jgi:glycosyltransferase involved in cell wall biosynthesis
MLINFTIVLPIYYKYGDLNKKAIESVLQQDKSIDFELLLIMHESDKVIDISPYSEISKIKIITVSVSNLVEKRNAGLMNAKSNYIIFLDCDDLLSADYLLNAHNIINNNKETDLVVFDYTRDEGIFNEYVESNLGKYFDNEDFLQVVYSKYKNPNKHLLFIDSVWAKVFRTDIIKSNNLLFTLTRGEDYLFVSEYLLYSKSLFYKNYISYYWRINRISLMSNNFWFETTFLFIENLNKILKRTNHISSLEAFKYYSLFFWEIGEYISSKKISFSNKTILLKKLIPYDSTFMKSIYHNRYSYNGFFWNILANLIVLKFYNIAILLLNIRIFLKKMFLHQNIES